MYCTLHTVSIEVPIWGEQIRLLISCSVCVLQKLTSQFISFDLIGGWMIVTAINWLQVGAIPV